MPQEKRRSINYRSFVICDDPRGVVECRAIRKSNIISPQKRGQQPSDKNTNKSLNLLIEEEKKEEVDNGGGVTRELVASFQQNNVINSCLNGKKDHQKHIDLRESLAMLNGLEKRRYGYLQDGKSCFSLRKSYDEMRKVVRESLLRQYVITNPVFEHNFDQRKQLGSPDMPSSSSSQSSMVYSSNFAPSDYSSMSSTSSQGKMGKGSNLMVKLMGLESLPSSPVRRRETEKILNLSKPVYNMDSPRARQPQFGGPELGLKQRSIHEILEALKIKGLLKSSSVNGLVPDSPHCEAFPSENKWVDGQGKPPIVVIKPLSFSSLDLKEPTLPKLQKDHMLIKPNSGRGPPQETVCGVAPNFSEKSIKKLDSCKGNTSANMNQKIQKKQEAVKKASEVVRVNSSRRKGEQDVAISSDELRSHDQARLSPLRIKRQKDGMMISKNQNFSQQKTASTAVLNLKTQKRSKSTGQQEKNRQAVLNGENHCKKGESQEIQAVYEEKGNAISQNECVLTVDSLIAKSFPTVERAETCHVQITEYGIEEHISLSGPQEDELMGSDKDSYGNYPDDNTSSVSSIPSASITEECNVGHLNENHPVLPEVTLVTTHENGIPVHLNALEEPYIDRPQNYHPSPPKVPSLSARETDSRTFRKFLTHRTKLKALILSSPSFASRAEELFDLQVIPTSVPLASNEGDPDLSHSKLLLYCANEVMELKSHKLSQACLPLPRSYKAHPQNVLSLDRLVEEICNGIEDLIGYLIPNRDVLFSNTLHMFIDRDLSFKSGTWEIGWRNAMSQDEVEHVIGEVDKLLLGKLIEEVVVDFML